MELATAATAAIAGTAALLGRQLQSNAASSQELSLARLDLTRLKKRLVNEDGLGTKERAIAALAEYKRFLQVVRLHPEESLQPCAAVDAVWQRHLLDTKEYAADCGAMFGAYGHRLYPKRPEAKATAALGRTRELYQQTHGVAPPADMWSELPMAPALISISSSLPRMPSRSLPARVWRPQGARDGAVENEDLEWLGTAVAKELPLKQSKCKHAEPLREIAMADPAATVVEYKRFLRTTGLLLFIRAAGAGGAICANGGHAAAHTKVVALTITLLSEHPRASPRPALMAPQAHDGRRQWGVVHAEQARGRVRARALRLRGDLSPGPRHVRTWQMRSSNVH